MVRATYYNKHGMKKGAWSHEEDDKLRHYIQKYGHWNWSELPKFAGLSRCGKSCRLRWMNYLRPNVKRGNYTQEEDDQIIKLHKQLGNKWCLIAAKLPGRTDNEIKNRWHTKLKKRVKHNTPTYSEVKHGCNQTSDIMVVENNPSPRISESSQLSTQHDSSSEASSTISSTDYTLSTIDLAEEDDFWTTPFFADTYKNNGDFQFGYPNISCADDVVDLFYKTMQGFPEEY